MQCILNAVQEMCTEFWCELALRAESERNGADRSFIKCKQYMLIHKVYGRKQLLIYKQHFRLCDHCEWQCWPQGRPLHPEITSVNHKSMSFLAALLDGEEGGNSWNTLVRIQGMHLNSTKSYMCLGP